MSHRPIETCAELPASKAVVGGLKIAVRYGEAPAVCGVQMGDFEPIRTQIILVEPGRSELPFYQALGFPKPKVVGSNPTAFTVSRFRTPSDPRVNGVGAFLRPLAPASYPPFLPDVAMTGSPTEAFLLSHKTPRFRYFKPLVRVLTFELSLSLPKRPKDLKHRLGPRTGTNPDFELAERK